MDFTGRDTFMAASFWAWVHGPAGAMATVGVVIASATVAEEVIEAGAAKRPAVAVMRAAAGEHAPAAVVRLAATQGLTIQAVRVPVQVMRQLRVAAAADIPAAVVVDMLPAAVVVDMPAAAVVVDMPAAADTDNL